MAESFNCEVNIDDEGIRIDKWISNNIPDLSRSYIQKLIESGNVLVDEISINKSSFKLKKGSIVHLDIPESCLPDIRPVNIPIDIIYEDDDLLIVNKPKGMVVHPAPGHFGDTLVNAVMYHCGNSLSGINGIMRPGIVHRIDRDTTGSIIICKNDNAHKSIAEQLKVHSIKRQYRAVVCGKLPETSGTIEGYIGRDPSDRKKMAITDSYHGKSAVTHYNVINEFSKFSYVQCELESGRTHQIRVHMNSIHHPVLGDPLYGNNLGIPSPMKLEGQCLHAYTIGFIHPTKNEYVEFEAPIPDYFNKLLDIISNQ